MADISQQQREIELHERIADDYRSRYGYRFSTYYHHYWNDRLISLLPEGRQLRVLDLACGTGFLLRDLVKVFPATVGIDLSAAMLAVAREKEEVTGRLIAGDACLLPFADGSFDTVVCRGSLHHFPDAEGTFGEIHRVLVKGGQVVFSEPSNEAFLIRAARKIMYHLSDKFDEEDEGYHLGAFVSQLEGARFNVEFSGRMGFLAYALSGFPDRLGLLKYVPGSLWLTRLFIFLDQLIEKVPVIQRLCFAILVKARKG